MTSIKIFWELNKALELLGLDACFSKQEIWAVVSCV